MEMLGASQVFYPCHQSNANSFSVSQHAQLPSHRLATIGSLNFADQLAVRQILDRLAPQEACQGVTLRLSEFPDQCAVEQHLGYTR